MCVLVSTASTWMESACRCDFRHLQCALQQSRHEAPTDDQACGCSKVRGGGGLKVCARHCLWHSGEEYVLPRPGICKIVVAMTTSSRHEAATGRAKLAAA